MRPLFNAPHLAAGRVDVIQRVVAQQQRFGPQREQQALEAGAMVQADIVEGEAWRATLGAAHSDRNGAPAGVHRVDLSCRRAVMSRGFKWGT